MGISREWTGVLVSALEKAGAIRALTGPFETRVEVLDHLKLEELPKKQDGHGVDDEIKEFTAKKKAEEEQLKNLFSSGDALRKEKEKMGKLADELQGFKDRTKKPNPLFPDD